MPNYIKNIHYISDYPLKELEYFVLPVIQIKQDDKNILLETNRIKSLDQQFGIKNLFEKEEFSGKKDSDFVFPNTNSPTLIFCGLGLLNEYQKYLEFKISQSIQNGLKEIKKKNISKIAIDLSSLKEGFEFYNISFNIKSLLTNVLIAFADYTYHTLEAKEISKIIENLYILANFEISENDRDFAKSVIEARASAMDLVNIPANIKTTNTLVQKAKSLESLGLKVEIIDDVNWIRENMPCFYVVAKGSLQTDPPKWIKVQYTPNTEIKHKIALIGKSVIFDTGGYQVKPDNYMNTMKADMTGGASVLSVIEQVAKLKLPYIQVTAYCPATPNKIDSDAMLPDSIVSTTCGKKVEIRHTDAEGRLTLIDAVAMAEKDGNDLFVTVATLTGSAARAVGPRIALMSTRPDKRLEFEKSLEEIGEPYQSLEVEEEDYEDIKSKLDGADINNTGSEKYRGAQTAAAFVFSGLSSLNKPLYPFRHCWWRYDKRGKSNWYIYKRNSELFVVFSKINKKGCHSDRRDSSLKKIKEAAALEPLYLTKAECKVN
jgi:leucyl aminopeptidase